MSLTIKDKENIFHYLNILLLKKDEIDIENEKLMGYSNNNYIITIKRKSNNKILGKYIYRKFGKISIIYDKHLENSIIKCLYKKGLGPNVLYEDKEYRISEYLNDTKHLDLSHLFDDFIIDSIIKILIIKLF